MKPLLPIAYLPPVSWIAAALKFQDISLELFETYPKQTIRNRCIIATANGPLNLTVPVIKINGNHTQTRDIVVDNSRNWQQLHWRSITTAYNKSPFFLYYRDSFETLYRKKYETLVNLNQEFLDTLFTALNIKTIKTDYTKDYISSPEQIDFRNRFNSKHESYQHIIKSLPRYMQVFEDINGFIPDMSVIDLLFNLGPDSTSYLLNLELTN